MTSTRSTTFGVGAAAGLSGAVLRGGGAAWTSAYRAADFDDFFGASLGVWTFPWALETLILAYNDILRQALAVKVDEWPDRCTEIEKGHEGDRRKRQQFISERSQGG